MQGKTLFVRIPSAEFQDICEKYTDLIQEAIDNLGLEIDTVIFTTPQQDPTAPRMREDGGFAPLPSHSANAPQARRPHTGATPSAGAGALRLVHGRAAEFALQFDNFVIGNGNQFARQRHRRSRSGLRRPTIRSSCMAAWAWARPT